MYSSFLCVGLFFGAGVQLNGQASPTPSGHAVPCDGAPAPEGKACCNKTPYDPTIRRSEETQKNEEQLFVGWAGTVFTWATSLEGKYKVDEKIIRLEGKICCDGKTIKDSKYKRTTAQESATFNGDLLAVPVVKQTVSILEKAAETLISILPTGRYEVEVNGSLPASYSRGLDQDLVSSQGCEEKPFCGGYSSVGSSVTFGGAVAFSVKAKDKDGYVIASYPVGLIGAAGTVSSAKFFMLNEKCETSTEDADSGCIRVYYKVFFLSGERELYTVGECE